MDGLERNIQQKINRLLENFPIVAILGVRQCGKSTISRTLGVDWKYFDLERPAHFEQINNDPFLFFKENTNHIIIDEAQIAPNMFPILRSIVDEDRNKNGRFIITGSSSFELIKNISESLAGRIAIVELSTLKMNELQSEKLSSFYNIFEKKISLVDLQNLKKLKSTKSIVDIKHYLLKGGYPQPVIKNDNDFHLDWMENYFNTYINRDMRSLFPKMDLLKYQRVIKMLSSLSGTIINKSEVARSAETSEKSVRDYLQIISGTFFWRELPAFKTSKTKTTISSPKGHYRDSGLLFYLQNVFTTEELSLYPKLGNAFESFVVEEVLRGIEVTKARNLNAYHFRTKAGAEIDLILEGSFGLVPIEIKYQSNTTKKQLHSMIDFIQKHEEVPYGIVLNNCEEPSLITENIIQIPVGCI
jgi:predicted AAA+ superfamily ATPase